MRGGKLNLEILPSRGGPAARRATFGEDHLNAPKLRCQQSGRYFLIYFKIIFIIMIAFWSPHPPFFPTPRPVSVGMEGGGCPRCSEHPPPPAPAPYLHPRGGGGCIPPRRRRLAGPGRAVPGRGGLGEPRFSPPARPRSPFPALPRHNRY